MNVLYLGSRDVGEGCFYKLLKTNFSIAGVVGDTRIFEKASKMGITRRLNTYRREEFILNTIESQNVDVLLSVKHPFILPKNIIDAVNGNAYNLHCGKLPEYQGWNACSHAILNREYLFTVTIHRMAEEVDTGDIIIESSFNILDGDTADSLDKRASIRGVRMFEVVLERMKENPDLEGYMMEGDSHFYNRELDREIKLYAEPAAYMSRMARAFHHSQHDPAYFVYKGIRYGVSPL